MCHARATALRSQPQRIGWAGQRGRRPRRDGFSRWTALDEDGASFAATFQPPGATTTVVACTTTLPDRLPDKLKSDVTQILSDSLPCGRILYYTVESLSETQWSRDDIPAIIEQCRDPQMMEFTRIPRPYTSEHAHQLLALARAGWQAASPTSPRFWAIAAPTATGYRFAGTIDYRPTGHRTATVGYGLHPAHRGAGLMSVALSLVLDYAFDHDGQELIHWQAAVGNWASAKAAWRNGFRLEGHVRGLCLRPDGGINDGWIATLHRDDPRTPGQPWPATT